AITMKVFIFGANCYLGSQLIKKLQKHHEVYTNNNIAHLNSGFMATNVFQTYELQRTLKQMHHIIYITNKAALPNAYLQGHSHSMHVWAIENILQTLPSYSDKKIHILNVEKKYNNHFKNLFDSQNVKVIDMSASKVINKIGKCSRPMQNKYKKVYSFQHMLLTKEINAIQLVGMYEQYLKECSLGWIRIKQTEQRFEISLKFLPYPLIKMEKAYSSPTNFILKVTGGLLVSAKGEKNGMLEFRTSASSYRCVIGLNHYEPALPWLVYLLSQAPIHKWVMSKLYNYVWKHY
ncbi:MAG: hypothetical protein L0L22_10365, partial [Staphylococcus equorum]|nr:hypothetical protein [Staphylococcus equorum]